MELTTEMLGGLAGNGGPLFECGGKFPDAYKKMQKMEIINSISCFLFKAFKQVLLTIFPGVARPSVERHPH